MKKITIITIALGLFIFALPVLASTVATLSPSSVNTTTGKTFSVTISVDPKGSANYAEKVEVNFPAENLRVSSFSLGSDWMALSQSGYDLIDNVNGILIKSAGYAGGFSQPTVLGTITFSVLKSGSGIIKIGNNSLAFDIKNQTAISGNEVPVSISSGTIAPTVNNAEQVIPTVEKPVKVISPINQEVINATNTQAAAVAVVNSPNYIWLGILAAIILILGGIVWWNNKNSVNKI